MAKCGGIRIGKQEVFQRIDKGAFNFNAENGKPAGSGEVGWKSQWRQGGGEEAQGRDEARV